MCRADLRLLAVLALAASLAGCAVYRPAPLAVAPPLAPSLAALNRVLPGGGQVDITAPLTPQNAAALAVLNNPDLAAARAQRGIAQAELLAAGLPPDPSITGGFAALLGGPGTMPAITAGLAQDLSAIVTYAPARAAAKAGLGQVDAGILWQEWQMAAQAEQLCVGLDAARQRLASLRAEQALLAQIDAAARQQVAASNLTLADASATSAALATTQIALDTEEQGYAQSRGQLDALLGLAPGVEIALAPPAPATIAPSVAAQAIATLAERRPDLIALRDGYTQADEKLRAAIWSQFLPVSLGATGGRDTSGVNSAGPQITLTLPLFNRNRPAIAAARATRAALAAQYAASLAGASGGAQSLLGSIALLQTQADAADAAADAARQDADAAHTALAAGTLDSRAAAALLTAAGDRTREAITLHAQLRTAQFSLATLLGLGLPPVLETTPMKAKP